LLRYQLALIYLFWQKKGKKISKFFFFSRVNLTILLILGKTSPDFQYQKIEKKQKTKPFSIFLVGNLFEVLNFFSPILLRCNEVLCG